jgi:hypothetical protein
LVHLFYVIAVLASGLATFGGSGLVPALVVLAVWGYIFARASRRRALAEVCLFFVCGFCCIGLLLPAWSSAREAAFRVQCANNLKQIGLALHNYHDVYGCFPPAYVADKDGKPMHSWRVLILPFIEEQRLYQAYRFDEPWDGPNNRKLAAPMPNVYACPSQHRTSRQPPTHSSYVAVVGPRTAWPGDRPRKLSEITDGTSFTLLVMEAGKGGVPWMAPRDPDAAEAIQLVTSDDMDLLGGHVEEDFFFEYLRGRQGVLADGSVRVLSHGMGQEMWEWLFTIDDGKSALLGEGKGEAHDLKRLKRGNCYRLAVFVLVALFPLPWVWIGEHQGPAESTTAEGER